jgi:hypothetical protein
LIKVEQYPQNVLQVKRMLEDEPRAIEASAYGYAEAAKREDNDCASHEKAAEVYGDFHDELKAIVDRM